jgi:hypothetical protein
MLRKASLILIGAAIGVAVTAVTTQSRLWLDRYAHASAADTYR